ncbi:MAG: hypothetical protein LBG58_09835 [Planctomycetaceae bacterium]|jgi:hypothetical protein|nr:hypothetical protein [Planctomycetaceae bacterium]
MSSIRYFVSILFIVFVCSSVFAERPSVMETQKNILECYTKLSLTFSETYPVKDFADCVTALEKINKDIVDLENERAIYGEEHVYRVLDRMQSQRTAAFFHAWAILTTRLKQNDPHTTEYLETKPNSVLYNLLTLLKQIKPSCAGEFLSQKLSPNTPDAVALIGEPSDEIDKCGDYVTIWAVVNYQNANRHQTEGVSAWLTAMIDSNNCPLYRWHDNKAETETFKQRLSKLNLYFTFRKWIADENNLEKLLEWIYSKLAEGQIVFNKDGSEFSNNWKSLIQAATPEENGEFLPDAAIWLRYILFASYQGLGGKHILNDNKTRIQNVWESNLKLPWTFDSPISQKDNIRVAPVWNQYPAEGSFNRLVADTTLGFLNMTEFQCQKIDAKKFEKLHKERTQSWIFDGVPDFEKQAQKQEITRLKQDYNDYTQMSENIVNFYKAKDELEKLMEGKSRFYDSKLQFRQLEAAYPEFAECSPIAMPVQRYHEYKEQLNDAIKNLTKYLDECDKSVTTAGEYETTRLDTFELKLETQAARWALLAAELAKQQAEIGVRIAQNNKYAAEFRLAATEYKKAAAENRQDSAELERKLAETEKVLRDSTVDGIKKGMEAMRHKIEEAERELNNLQELLTDKAWIWRKEIKKAEEKAARFNNIINICKTSIYIVGAIANICFPGAGSLITVCSDLVINSLNIHQEYSLGGISKEDVLKQGLVAVSEAGAKIHSIYGDYKKTEELNGLKKITNKFNEQRQKILERYKTSKDRELQQIDESEEKEKNDFKKRSSLLQHQSYTAEYKPVKFSDVTETSQKTAGETQKESMTGAFYKVPLPLNNISASKILIRTSPSNKCEQDANIQRYHEVFILDDGTWNTGYNRGGIENNKPDIPADREPCISNDNAVKYNGEIMKQAAEYLEKSGQWKDSDFSVFAPAYNTITHNCQDYADALRKEYRRIESQQKQAANVPRKESRQKESQQKQATDVPRKESRQKESQQNQATDVPRKESRPRESQQNQAAEHSSPLHKSHDTVIATQTYQVPNVPNEKENESVAINSDKETIKPNTPAVVASKTPQTQKEEENAKWKENLKSIAKEVVRQSVQLSKAINNDKNLAKKLKNDYVNERSNKVWMHIQNDINRAISFWPAKDVPTPSTFSGMKIKHDGLNEAIVAVLQSGGVFAFDLDNPKVFEILHNTTTNQDDLNKAFIDNLKDIFVQLEFTEQQQEEPDIFQNEYSNKIKELQNLLRTDLNASKEFWDKVNYSTKFYINVEDNGKINIVVEDSQTARYNACVKEAYSETVQPILNEIEMQRQNLETAVNKADTPDKLDEVAGEIPKIIEELKKQLQNLDGVLAKAVMAMENAEKKLEIAELLSFAAHNDFLAAEANLEAGKLDVDTAKKELEKANIHVKETENSNKSVLINYEAKQIMLKKAEYLLRNAYRRYVLSGQSTAEPLKPITLSGAVTASITNFGKQDLKREELVAEICRNYCGLLRWLNLFNATTPQTAMELFNDLLEKFEQRNIQDLRNFVKFIEKQSKNIDEGIRNRSNKVEFTVRHFSVAPSCFKFYPDPQLTDFSDDPEFVEWYQERITRSQTSLPVARIDFSIPKDTTEMLLSSKGEEGLVWNNVKKNYIVLTSEENSTNLYNVMFLLKVTGYNSTKNNGFPMQLIDNRFLGRPDQIVNTSKFLLEKEIKEEILEGIEKNSNEFYGLYGTWRFYLFTNNPDVLYRKDENGNYKPIQDKSISVQLPILWIAP